MSFDHKGNDPEMAQWRRSEGRAPVFERVWTFGIILFCGPVVGYVAAHGLLWLRSL